MHDPMVLVFDLPWIKLDVWHNEPKGRDSGTICKGMGSTELSWHNVRWAVAHRHHLSYRFWPYLRVKRWIVDRCGECGRRFFWKDGRFGYMNGTAVYHDACMTLRHVRSQLDDATKYLQGTADNTARWRVEYRLRNLDAAHNEQPAEAGKVQHNDGSDDAG